jgi:hypothetical protein
MHIVPTSQHAVGGGMPPIPSLAPSFAGRRRGLGQDEMDSYDQWYYGVDQYGAPTGGNQNPGEIFMPSVIESNYSEADWAALDAAAQQPGITPGLDLSLLFAPQDQTLPDFTPTPEEIDTINLEAQTTQHLVDIGILDPAFLPYVQDGTLALADVLNFQNAQSAQAQRAVAAAQQAIAAAAPAKAKQAAAASGAAGGSGSSMSIPTGSKPTAAQQAAQAAVAVAKTPAEIAAAQAALVRANAAAAQPSWFDQEMIKGVKNSWLVLGGFGVLLFSGGSSLGRRQEYYETKAPPPRRRR